MCPRKRTTECTTEPTLIVATLPSSLHSYQHCVCGPCDPTNYNSSAEGISYNMSRQFTTLCSGQMVKMSHSLSVDNEVEGRSWHDLRFLADVRG